MTYELAKELKEAGFPEHVFDGEHCKRDCWLRDGIGRKEHLHCPSLSELIEACGKDFYSVNQNATSDGKGWSAESWSIGDIETGTTPEEAVARLWLALQPTKQESN